MPTSPKIRDHSFKGNLPYRFKKLYDSSGQVALLQINRKKPNRKNRVTPKLEIVVVQIPTDQLVFGQVRDVYELKKPGFVISPGGIRSVWLGHDLETSKNG